MKQLLAFGMGVALSTLSATVQSSPLDAFLIKVERLEAAFVQTQTDEDGELLAESSGRLWIQRPGRFRWSYTEPYEQHLVSDGKAIYIIDPDLDQVTIRDADRALQDTPAAVLSSDDADLSAYEVIELGGEGGMTGVRLTPRDPDAEFRSVEMWFDDGVPTRLTFVDPLGGQSVVRFIEPRVNPAIDPQRFAPQWADGAEVIDTRQDTE